MRGKTPPIRPLIGLGILLLLGAGVRLLYMVYPIMDADQAINGLMGRHILLGEFPIFFYGQEYCGSFENYLLAVVFLLFGANRFTLDLTIAIISLFLVFFIYCFTVRIADRRTALLAALLTAFPSNYFAFTSVLARSAYIESPLLGFLLFIVAERLFWADQRRPAFYLLLGFLGGLGLWTHFLFVFYLAPVGLLLLFKEKGFWKDPRVLLFLGIGLILGGLPLWMYNTVRPLATWHFLQANPIHESFGESLKAFFSTRFPELLGLRSPLQKQFYIPYFSVAFYVVLLGGVLYLVYNRFKGLGGGIRRGETPRGGFDLLVIFVLLYPLIFSFSGFAANHTTRYLVPLYPAIPIIVSFFFFYFKKRVPFLAWSFLVIVLAFNGYGASDFAVVLQPKQVQEYNKRDLLDQTLIRFLKENRIGEVYVSDYWKAVPLTFIAREEILFAQPYFDRYPPFTRLVDRSNHPAFLLSGDETAFESTLTALGGSYKKKRIGDRWIFYDFLPPPYTFSEVLSQGWRAYPDGPAASASVAFDRNLATRWNLGRVMEPGDMFHLDLGKTIPDLGRVTLFAGSGEGLPRGLRLEISSEGTKWRTVRDIPNFWNSLVWSGPHPFVRPGKGVVELVFPPQPGRYLRFTQTGSDVNHGWEIAEVLVYRAALSDRGVSPRAFLAGDLMEHWVGKGDEPVLASPWIGARTFPLSQYQPNPEVDYVRLPDMVEGRLPAYPFPEFLVGREQADGLRQALELLRPGMYQEISLEELILFHASRFRDRYRVLSRSGWQATSNFNNREAWKAIDGKIKTRWSSGTPQVPGILFRLDLGRLERMNRARLRLGDSYRDYPREVEIYFSMDGRRWEKAFLLNEPLYWDGERLFKDWNNGEIDLVFREVRARFIEIRQTGRDPLYYWSIHELELLATESTEGF